MDVALGRGFQRRPSCSKVPSGRLTVPVNAILLRSNARLQVHPGGLGWREERGKRHQQASLNPRVLERVLEVLAGADDNQLEDAHAEDQVALLTGGSLQPEAESVGVEPSAGDVPALEDMLRSAISAQLEDDGWALLSNVGFQLVANYPTFDSRNYGFPRLGLLLRDQSFADVREMLTAGGNKVLHVRLAE